MRRQEFDVVRRTSERGICPLCLSSRLALSLSLSLSPSELVDDDTLLSQTHCASRGQYTSTTEPKPEKYSSSRFSGMAGACTHRRCPVPLAGGGSCCCEVPGLLPNADEERGAAAAVEASTLATTPPPLDDGTGSGDDVEESDFALQSMDYRRLRGRFRGRKWFLSPGRACCAGGGTIRGSPAVSRGGVTEGKRERAGGERRKNKVKKGREERFLTVEASLSFLSLARFSTLSTLGFSNLDSQPDSRQSQGALRFSFAWSQRERERERERRCG